ncbi:expressed protein [Phakopsora pachyrhizi]|uniref:Expressed protein n=1 Tax=Phakopsora pachyrhizi TaxID=170000 RepID=A0AAV0AT65_PHAPC|nr:expressed protein [Phakopsora pachyrhizi]
MCTLKKIHKEESVSANDVLSGLSVQHHCAGAKCLIKITLARNVERQQTDMMLKEVHNNYSFNLCVINTALLRAQDGHHDPARIPTSQIQVLDSLNAVHDGLSEWKKKKAKLQRA